MNATPDTPIIEARGVTKRFGALAAVDRLDYALRQGDVAGIIGANGAGKTTLFNLLTGYFSPDEGTILFRGEDITHATPQHRVRIGIARTFQLASTFDDLSVVDNLVLGWFHARRGSSLPALLRNTCKARRNEEQILEALASFDLARFRDQEVRHLSLGEKRRLEIAMALLGEPQVLLLDEPLAGLADTEARSILEVLRGHAGRWTILIVEHKLSHMEDFLQRLTVMHEGRIIADGPYEETLRHPDVRRCYWQIDAATVSSEHAAP